jgi:hypothetical protein
MSRLTNHVREQMATTLARHKMNAQAEVLMAESAALFALVYEHEYPAPVQRAMVSLLKLRPDALQKSDYMLVNVRGQRFNVGRDAFGYNDMYWTPEVPERPFCSGKGRSGISFLEGELHDRLDLFATARRKFTEEVKNSRIKALSTLGQFTTSKKLVAEWPEALPVIGSLIPEDDRTVPVVQLGSMNEDFGLPPAERIAA